MLLLVVVHCIPDWLKQRYPWYIQTFNIANYTLAGFAAWVVARAIGFAAFGWREAAAGVAAAVAFVVVNRVLLMPMLMLGRGLTLSETGLLDAEDTSLELVLAFTAVTLAALWDAEPLARRARACAAVRHPLDAATRCSRLEETRRGAREAHAEEVIGGRREPSRRSRPPSTRRTRTRPATRRRVAAIGARDRARSSACRPRSSTSSARRRSSTTSARSESRTRSSSSPAR